MEAKVPEFRRQISKNMGDYVEIDGKPAVESVGQYIVELYENILSRRAQKDRNPKGAISVSRKTHDGYDVLTSHVYKDIDDAKNMYIDMVHDESIATIEHFVEKHRTNIE